MKFYRFIAAFLFFSERYEIKETGTSFEVPYRVKFKFYCFLIVLFDCKYPSFKFSKRRNHLKPENLETPFLLSALKMPIKSVTTTKQKQNT